MVKRSNKTWIQRAHVKPGALSRQIGVPIAEDIPMGLLNKIITSEPGTRFRNPFRFGKRIIKVTKLMKERAVLARTFKRFPRRK